MFGNDLRDVMGDLSELIRRKQRDIALNTLNTSNPRGSETLHVLQGRVFGLSEALAVIDAFVKKREGREDD